MLGGDNNNPIFIEDNQIQYHLNAVNQLQLFGNLPAGCNVDSTNYIRNDQNTPMLRPNKRGREAENISRQQKLQNSLSYNLRPEEADCLRGIQNQTRVSTGLKLSYDDDERNSSVTSSSSSMIATPPFIMSLGDKYMRTELDRQKDELDQYIKTQEQVLAKGMMDITERQMAHFLSTIEKGVNKKLQEKDLEIENIKYKNIELGNKIQQAATDAQWWHNKAKQNESRINTLKNHLHQVISNGVDHAKEGFGDSEIDDAASYIDPNIGGTLYGNGDKAAVSQSMKCKACKCKEVSVLLMPCRHLCLCKECDTRMMICPVCHIGKTASVQVYFP